MAEVLGRRSLLCFGVLLAWLVLFHLLVNIWLLCVFTSLLVVLGGWLGSQAFLESNSLVHLERFISLKPVKGSGLSSLSSSSGLSSLSSSSGLLILWSLQSLSSSSGLSSLSLLSPLHPLVFPSLFSSLSPSSLHPCFHGLSFFRKNLFNKSYFKDKMFYISLHHQ